ncbi:hypothetical protein SynMITS9220_02459 [Synechococcus sp. MIT S9220]|uniref:DUF3086 domain-containing protein n=1 Tax=unclassified Synechococcus TaxID=2626047 RepID=UPI00164B3080|nr:DUF3086 domain-containing protein [Synechococcus sp. MIT S9220]NOL46196.1 DUF3086 domain-containing protein [Synechococcus sp. MIT S9220]QNJ23743.1 hypothetical protein SynMITS9220_02459 [Synechococcus sp. MIT S9220]|tara:strand:+ start:709 stop:1695 length:987 start_codon:yes stop_codon:yes gene_type:complete
MPDDNDLPLQDTPQSTEAANDASSEASHAASEDVQPASETLIQLALVDLQTRRDGLQQEIESLQQRKQQLEKDMAASFAGQSDAIARRVKGFQEYLGGALQGLAQSVETLELVAQPVVVKPSPLDAQAAEAAAEQAMANSGGAPALADTFRPDEELIRTNLRRFLEQPDFYAEPWKLRRSLDDSDIAVLEDWFFNQGGRGAQASRGSRPRNVLLGAALIAIIGELYGDQFQTLVLAGQPERLGDWRRGLQDALGLGREDFGPSSGIVLFERGDALVERADRLEERGEVPLILIDAAERVVDVPVLQFPLWLAFAAGPGETYDYEDDLL